MTTPNIDLPELAANQAQPHLTVNAALRRLDALLQASIIAIQNAPPGSPADGDRYIVGGTPSGAWVGHEDDVAAYVGTAWQFLTPQVGWLVFLRSANALYLYGLGSPDAWEEFEAGGSIVANDAWATAGDLIVGTGAGTAAILPAPASLQALFCDGAGNLYWDVLVPPSAVRHIKGFFPGIPGNGQLLYSYYCDDHIYFYVGDMNGQARVGPSDSPEAEVTVKITGVTVGIISFDSTGFGFGTDEGTSAQHAYPGDVIEFYNQAITDSTMEDIALSGFDTPAP